MYKTLLLCDQFASSKRNSDKKGWDGLWEWILTDLKGYLFSLNIQKSFEGKHNEAKRNLEWSKQTQMVGHLSKLNRLRI